MKLYSAYYQGEDPFKIFDQVIGVSHPAALRADGALILWGGEDISPGIYNQEVVHSRAPATPSHRDAIEMAMFKTAVQLGMPIIGICRGAQLACALSGGTLFQHLKDGHHETHEVSTHTGDTFKTSSCHHQAMNVLNMSENDYELLAWDKGRATKVFTESSSFNTVIPEVINFKETRAFAIQGHPEWMNPKSPFVQWCANEIKERYF